MKLTRRLVKMLALVVALMLVVPGMALGAPKLSTVEIANLVVETNGQKLDFSPISLTLQSGVDAENMVFVEKAILRPTADSLHGVLLNVGKKGISLAGTHVSKGVTISYLDMAAMLQGFAPEVMSMMPANMELPDAAFEAGSLFDSADFSDAEMEKRSAQVEADILALYEKYITPYASAPVKETRDFYGAQTEMERIDFSIPADALKGLMTDYFTYIYSEDGLYAKLFGESGKAIMNLMNNAVKMSDGKSMVDTMTQAMDQVEFTQTDYSTWTLDDYNMVMEGTMVVTELATPVVVPLAAEETSEDAATETPATETPATPETVTVTFDVSTKGTDELNLQMTVDADIESSAKPEIVGMRMVAESAGDAAKSNGMFDMIAGPIDEKGGPVKGDDEGSVTMNFTYDSTETSFTGVFTMKADDVTVIGNLSVPEIKMDGDRLAKLNVDIKGSVVDAEDADESGDFSFTLAYDQPAAYGPLALDVSADATIEGKKSGGTLSYTAEVSQGETGDNYAGHVKLGYSGADQNGTVDFDLNMSSDAIAQDDYLPTEAGETMVNFAEITPEEMSSLQTEATGWIMSIAGELMTNPGVQAIGGNAFAGTEEAAS